MNRYITSADALKTLNHLAYETALNQHDPYVADVFEDIAKNRLETWVGLIPTADVQEVKHGKWIHDGYDFPHGNDWIHCSVCGKRGINVPADLTNYCPNCGAKMERSEDAEIHRCGCADEMYSKRRI